MAVLYRHIKPNGEVFYIGISNSNRNRAYQKGEYERNNLRVLIHIIYYLKICLKN